MEIIRKMQILCFQIWSTAASQIFFSLSVGYYNSLFSLIVLFILWIFWSGMAVNWPSQATITSPTIVTGCINLNKPIVTTPVMNGCIVMRYPETCTDQILKILLMFSTGTHSSSAFATHSPPSSPALSSLQFSATSPTEDLSAKLSR